MNGSKKKTAAAIDAPPLDILVKLGSLLVHVEEFFDNIPGGAASLYPAARFDVPAIRSILSDEDLQKWRKGMGALLPVKRQ